MSRIDSYSRQAATTQPGSTDYPKLDRVPNGTYAIGINGAELKELDKGTVFTLKLKVLDGVAEGVEVDYDNWLEGVRDHQLQFNERAVGRLKEELSVLGIRHEEWPEFEWFACLRAACPTLRGRCFRGEKSTNIKGGTTYHNLLFVELTPPPARRPSGPHRSPPPASANDSIPF